MDLWVEISLGRKWIDDERYIHRDVKVQQEVMFTSTTPRLVSKLEFLKAMAEAFDQINLENDLIDKHGTK